MGGGWGSFVSVLLAAGSHVAFGTARAGGRERSGVIVALVGSWRSVAFFMLLLLPLV